MGMRSLVLALAAGAAAVATAEGIEAQVDSRPRISFEARIGFDHPTRDLGRTDVLGGDFPVLGEPATPQGYAAFETVDAAPVVAGGVIARLSEPVSLRLSATYGLETDVRGQWYCEGFSICPLVPPSLDGTVRRWSAGVDVLFQLPHLAHGFNPMAFVGLARRATSVRWLAPNTEVPLPMSYDEAQVVLRPGIGVTRTLGAVELSLEADAAIGGAGQRYPHFIEGTKPPDHLGEPKTRVDLGMSVGARFRLW